MIVIRRMVDRHRAYTGIFLQGVPPKIFPTSDHEHARILQIYKQDRGYADVTNDFSDFGLGPIAARRRKNENPAGAGLTCVPSPVRPGG